MADVAFPRSSTPTPGPTPPPVPPASPRAVVAVVLVDGSGALLLQLRDGLAAAAPGRWSTVGGGVDAGESPAAAATRELAEETGLVGLPLHPWWDGVLPGADGAERQHWHVFVAATGAGDADIRLGEGADIRFVAAELLPGLDLVAGARTVLERLVSSPAYRALRGG